MILCFEANRKHTYFCWKHGKYKNSHEECPKCKIEGELLTAEEMLAELEHEENAE